MYIKPWCYKNIHMAHLLCKAAHTARVAWGAQECLQHLEAKPEVAPLSRAAWGPQSSGTLPTHPGSMEDQEGSLAALCWIQASAATFFRCLTPPAGELTQRKVRAGLCQGSAVQRKDYTESMARSVASAQFTTAKVAIMQQHFQCIHRLRNQLHLSRHEYRGISDCMLWGRVQKLIAKNRKEMLPSILVIHNYEKKKSHK